MDWGLIWNAFGAIGGILGALSTTIAVIVALWQVKYAQKKKVKLFLKENATVISQNENFDYQYITLTITNIGNRYIVIDKWGLFLNKKEMIFILKDTSPILESQQVNLPHKLEIEESISLFYKKENFLKIMRKYVENKKINQDKKVKFFIIDSTGKFYIIKTRKPLKKYFKNNL